MTSVLTNTWLITHSGYMEYMMTLELICVSGHLINVNPTFILLSAQFDLHQLRKISLFSC